MTTLATTSLAETSVPAMEESVTLYLLIHEQRRLALSIPISECTTKSSYPLKWLRFVGYAIYGEEGHLHLSGSRGSQPISNYTSNIEARSYYFISPDQPRLVDAMGIDDRTSMKNSSVTTRRHDFRVRVVERDGFCVMSDTDAMNCEAAHIIPHSKTDDYMSNLVSIRARPDDHLEMEGIDDARNGLLLNILVHHHLVRGELAFLKTPNFALTVHDVPGLPEVPGPPEVPASRLTLQHFGLIRDAPFRIAFPTNSDARQPDDLSEWPPDPIFDFFYGCAALKAWGPTPFKEFIKNHNFKEYYRSAEAIFGEKGDEGSEEVSEQVKKRRAPYKQREERRKRGRGDAQEGGQDEFGEVMDLVMGLWMRHAPKCQPEQDIAHIPKVDHSQDEKVEAWLQSS